MLVLLLLIISIIELSIFFLIDRDVLSPSFIFTFVFVIAELNVLTNIKFLGVEFHSLTVWVMCGGILFFSLGASLMSFIRIKHREIKIVGLHRDRKLNLTNIKLIAIICFNIVATLYVFLEVVGITRRYGFNGSAFEALGRYAELSKFSRLDVKVSTISTLLTALAEAGGYVYGFIIAKNLVYKRKNGILLYLCFFTSFISTFCQGSRGGIYMLITSFIIFIMLWREKNGTRKVSGKVIGKTILIVVVLLVVFQQSGHITGKNWDVSAYEYISVYIGDPIINLDTVLEQGIEPSPMWGLCTFRPIISNIFPRFGLAVPAYAGLKNFQILNGHNLGNVYTIFAYLIADFGIFGMLIALFIIGYISRIIYKAALKSRAEISMAKILYGYALTSIGFSFFSNKFCENLSIYHIYVFVFGAIIAHVLTRRKMETETE